MSIKEKTINGFLWSLLENFSKQGISFIIGIILARLLLPEEFGLLGMITVFIAISTSFINSGFTQALIRKQNCTNTDYSTVFYFNLFIGSVFVIALYFCAPFISQFFDEPMLTDIVRVLSIVLIFDALVMVQRSQLTKRIDFKLQTKLTLISDSISGVIAIILAYKGFGVWSLVFRQLIARLLYTVLIWFYNKWMPSMVFSMDSFKELFGFGSKLLLSGLLNTVFQNIYFIVIGKYFSASELGYYTRADQFKKLPSQNINSTIQRVSYPVLAKVQNSPEELKVIFIRLLKTTMFVTFILMLGLAAIADPLILTLLGTKWANSIGYLQLLVFVGMFYPLHSLNLNLLNVKGRSDLFLKLAIVKKILHIPIIFVGIFFGIEWMIFGMIVNSFIAFFLNSYFSGRYIHYSSRDQLLDIWPSFFLALVIGSAMYSIDLVLNIDTIYILLLQLFLGFFLTIGIGEFFKIKDYFFIKNLIYEQINKLRQ